MNDRYMHLIGAEQVQNAAASMRRTAEEMIQSARNIDGSLERHQRFMDDWLMRFEACVEKLVHMKDNP